MSKRRTERLLSIVVLLLSSRRYLTAEQIRGAVSGYPPEQEAFKRMFERDKEELRDLGIPLETGRAAAFDDDVGYRISRQDYELPEIHLEADEAAVLGIASQVWQSAERAGAVAGAALKLRAASREADDAAANPPPGIQPRLTTQEPAFGPLWEAVCDRRPVSFDHRTGGGSEVKRRTLEPWGVVNRRGRWYVAGYDRARADTRVFRLDRITGPVKMAGPPGSVKVPADADVRELVRDWDKPQAAEHTATLRVRTDGGVALHRWGGSAAPDSANPGWDLITADYSDPDSYAGYIASFGADVIVLEPPELREAVIRRLKGSAG